MSKTKHNATSGGIDSDLSPAAVFQLLANDRRRFALQYLSQSVGAVHLSGIADQIALREGEHTRERYERICTSLVHVHLPKLTDAGVVQYDQERETVELLETVDQIRPYLELSEQHDS